jgi:TIR domain
MPLDQVGKEYATMLYQKRFNTIVADQSRELQKVAEDFGARNMTQSGMYLSARAKVVGKHAGLMAEAMTQTLAEAYERSGLPLNETMVREITNEVNQFCEGQKRNFQQTASNMVSHAFSGSQPENLAAALAGEMERSLANGISNALLDLRIKHHEIVLDEQRTQKAYAAAMGKRWDVFISHASEDKESFVRPLATALERTGLRVWFDETALTVGDSLRRNIDEGLANSRYGIVVLSANFFAKPWPQQELDGLVSKEISGIKVILPIWHNIDFDGVRTRSPLLAGRLAAKSSDGIEKVVSDVRAAMGL